MHEITEQPTQGVLEGLIYYASCTGRAYERIITIMIEELIEMHGAPSWRLTGSHIDLYITRQGGHIAPVLYRIGSRQVSPLSLAPWRPEETASDIPPILRTLRGDFFCLPFGQSGKVPLPHGDTANLNWEFEARDEESLTLCMRMNSLPGVIRKSIRIGKGQPVLYQSHEISGLSGDFNYGHHAILQFPDKGGPYFINTSPIRFGSVKPDPFTRPEIGEYSALKTGARFKSLSKVPMIAGGYADLHEYPARHGFEDLVMISNKPSRFAWTAATLDGYVWISLKDPKFFPSTLMWFSNGGRHYAPWNGLHRNRVGLEEVNSHFSDGLEVSRKDLLASLRIPTTARFSKKSPTILRQIHAVAQVPKDFGMVADILHLPDTGELLVQNGLGAGARVQVDLDFLFSGI